MPSENKAEGARAEQLAADFLKKKGVRILAQNYRTRQGEVDLVGFQDGVYLFVEVKYRKTSRSGAGFESVTAAKQRKICGCALHYLWRHDLGSSVPVRFDVISIDPEGILWIRDAFPFTAPGRYRF